MGLKNSNLNYKKREKKKTEEERKKKKKKKGKLHRTAKAQHRSRVYSNNKKCD